MTVDLRLLGDINLKDDLGFSADAAFGLLSEELRSADIRIGNLEGCFSDPAVELPYKPGWFHCEPEMAPHLRGLVDAVACANNVHFGRAIADSIRHLDELGILHTGAGGNLSQARCPAIIERPGLRLGLQSYTSVFTPLGHAATAESPGVATIRCTASFETHPRHFEMPGIAPLVRSAPDAADLDRACRDVRSLRDQVDLVVVYCHWGVTGSSQPTEYQRTIGHSLVDAGADLVVGSHPHRAQAVERYQNGIIFYSLGNFAFGWKLHREATRDGLLVRVAVENGACRRVGLVPVARNAAGQTEALDTERGRGAELAAQLIELSAQQGTQVSLIDGELRV